MTARTTSSRPRDASHRYRVFGFVDGALGLAQASRTTIDVLSKSGRYVEAHDVGPLRRVPLQLFRRSTPERPRDDHTQVNIFHLNPLDIWKYPTRWAALTGPRDLNACVPFWELPQLPRHWVPWLGAADCVLAATRFIGDACRHALPGQRVIPYPLTKQAPNAAPSRHAFGLSKSSTVFLIAFDWQSDPTRKNPMLGIRAFREAFPRETDVQLIVKVGNMPNDASDPAAVDLMELIRQDRRVRLITETLPERDLFTLYASADALLSLHRAEGLGLHLMEAMSMGKCVVATGYSGNIDFMDESCSWLVPYDLVQVKSQHPVYAAACCETWQVWAEPRLADAVRALREVHAHPELRHQRGERARQRIEERALSCQSGAAFDELETQLGRESDSTGRFRQLARMDFLRFTGNGVVRRFRRRLARVTNLVGHG